MSADFDPYYTWLGIPPDEQPPNHYRLLGVKPFETNSDVIANAVDRQVMHIRTFQQGKFADHSQQVLNKLSAARVCLLNADSKTAYDKQLRQQLDAASPKPAAAAPAKPKLATAKPLKQAAPIEESSGPVVAVVTGPAPHPGPHGAQGAPSQNPAPFAPPMRQDLPPWVLPVGIGGVAAVLLGGGLIAFWVLGSSSSPQPNPNPPIVHPGPGPRPPFPGPGPGPGPGPANSGFSIQSTSPSPVAANQQGMVGRLLIADKDAGVSLLYLRGASFSNSALGRITGQYPIPKQGKRRAEFVGWVNVASPTRMLVRHAGGGNGSNAEVKISNKVVNFQQPGSKTMTETPVTLQPGAHEVRWYFELPDPPFDQYYCRFEMMNADTMQPVYVNHQQQDRDNGGNKTFGVATVTNTSLDLSPWSGDVVSGPGPGSDPFKVVPGVSTPPASIDVNYPESSLDGESSSTKGLVGRLYINNMDTGVVIRYRMSGVVSQKAIEAIRTEYRLPPGAIRLRLEGRLAYRMNTELGIRAWGGSNSGSASLTLANQSAQRLGRDRPTYDAAKARVNSQTGGSYISIAWELEGDDIGDCALEFKNDIGNLLTPSYTSTTLRSIGSAARHEAFVARKMGLSTQRPNYAGLAISEPPPPPEVGPGPVPMGTSVAGIVVKGEEELDDTTGLLGRLTIDGQDVGVLVRYRLGAPMKASWFDDLRRELKLPAGTPKLEMKSKTMPMSSSTSLVFDVEGGVRDGGDSEFRFNERRYERTGGTNFTTKGKLYDFVQQNTTAPVLWTLKGLPQGSASVKVAPQGSGATPTVAYTTDELRAERKHPLRAEAIYTPKNLILLKWGGGRTTSAIAFSTEATGGVTTLPNPALTLAGAEAEAAKRHPEPDAAAKTAAAKQVRDIFGKDIDAAKSAADKASLSQKMLKVSQETGDDPAARYMLLISARDMAAGSGDASGISQAVEELAQNYEVDSIRLREEAFVAAGKATIPPETLPALAQAALDAVELAVEADRFDSALKIVDVAVSAGTRSKDKELQKNTVDRRKELLSQKKQFDAVDAAQKALAANAEDPAANLAVGKYYTFVKSDWAKGASHLAKGSDSGIGAAAKLDVALPTDADARVKAGDAWWTAADAVPEDEKVPLKVRAHYWYKLALPDLDGLAKLRIEKRVAEVDADAQRLNNRTANPGAKPGAERPVQGLVLRAQEGTPPAQRPTHLLAVVSDSTDIDNWVKDSVRKEIRALGLSFSANYNCSGYIYLPQNAAVTFEVRYTAVVLKGQPLMRSQFTATSTTVNLPRGYHPVTFFCTDSYSSEFKAIDASTKANVLFYLPSQLKKDLEVTVAGPGGAPLKSVLLKKP